MYEENEADAWNAHKNTTNNIYVPYQAHTYLYKQNDVVCSQCKREYFCMCIQGVYVTN